MSTKHHSGSRYFDYDETKTSKSNPSGQFYRPGAGGTSIGNPLGSFDGKLWLSYEEYIGVSFDGGIWGLPNPHGETNIEWINDTLDVVSALSAEGELAFKMASIPIMLLSLDGDPSGMAFGAGIYKLGEAFGVPGDVITIGTNGPLSGEGLYVWLKQAASGPGGLIFSPIDAVMLYNDLYDLFTCAAESNSN